MFLYAFLLGTATSATPTLYYPFDDGSSGSVTTEAMGTGNSLGIIDATINRDNPLDSQLGGSWGSGTAIFMDGSGDYAYASDNSIFEPSTFTISVWLNSSSFASCGSNHCTIVSKANSDSSANGYWLITDGNGRVRLTIADGYNETSVYGPTLSENSWQHLVVTFDGSNVDFYENGAYYGTSTVSHSISYGSENFYIGKLTNRSYDFYGYLDEFYLYSSVLSIAEVSDLYNDYLDSDGDGWSASDDCDDSDASIYPGAAEYCDGVDTDCDNTLDEDDALDALTWYADTDGDSYGDATSSNVTCYISTGWVADSSDCDDSTASTYPGAAEYCDGVDSDCDNTLDEDDALDAPTWYADTDGDSYGDATSSNVTCYISTGWVADSSDCDDSTASTYPGAAEYCDGVDSDCDNTLDEDDALDALTWYADTDEDGNGDANVTDIDCYEPVGFVPDSSDCDDTNASLNMNDIDSDGFVTCEDDCDDMDAAINSAATEIWYDGVDQDCDAWSDYDQDGDGFDSANDPDADGQVGNDCDDEDFGINVEALEVWYDGVDQNCDGWSDYDADGDGYDSESYEGDDCDDGDAAVYPDAPDEPYDDIITDCNNVSDYDADGDGFDSAEFGGDDCDDANSGVNIEALEIWYDGIDQDCDGNDDDQDGDGYTVDDDCDDLDYESYPSNGQLDEDCQEILYDTGDTGGEPIKSRCEGCSGTSRSFSSVWFMALVALVFRRRKS